MKTIAYLVILVMIFSACEKEHSVSGPVSSNADSNLPLADTALITDTTIFFDLVMNGHRELEMQPLNHYGVYWEGNLPTISRDYGIYIQGITNNSNRGIEITRGNIKVEPEDSTLKLIVDRMVAGFDPGPYAYTPDPNTTTGIQIKWQDGEGKTWSTAAGSGDQSNSNFQITDRTIDRDPATGIVHGIYIRCTFNCILYDTAGNSIQVTNGKVGISVWI